MDTRRGWIGVLAAGMAVFLCGGCDEAPMPPPPPVSLEAVPDYPFDEPLRDNNGREIQVTVVGRVNDELVFTKAGNEKRYRYKIDELAQERRDFYHRLPKTQWYPPTIYEKGIRAEMARIDARIREAENEIEKNSYAPSRVRGYERTIEALELEKKDLEAKIEQRNASERGT